VSGPLPVELAEAVSLPASFGDYELLEKVGRGGMGVVYRARQKSLGRYVALKLCRAGVSDASAGLTRFHHEAAMIAQLDHPHVVPIHEVGEFQGVVFFSMKWLEGGSLDARLERCRADPRASATLLVAAGRAVHHAHQRGILHRDLKPSNILLDHAGNPHVTDFGLAKWGEAEVNLTQSGTLVGTPAYMAPEQAAGENKAITTATDVYGLGAVLYALLTGRAPFVGRTVFETLQMVKDGEVERPVRSNPRVPRDLETICLKCLRRTPAERYESAAALADDLERWLRGEPIVARPAGRFERLTRWARRQPVQAALSAGLMLTIVIGFALIAWQWRRAEANATAADELRQEAVARQVEADENFHLAHEAVRDMTPRLPPAGREDASPDPERLAVLKKAQAYYQKFLERRAGDPTLIRELAVASANLADITRRIASPEQALPAYNRALALCEELRRDYPDDAAVVHGIAVLHNQLGTLQDTLGRHDTALELLTRAQTELDNAIKAYPRDARFAPLLAMTHHNRGMILTALHRVDAAREAFASAEAVWNRLLAADPDAVDHQIELANTVNSLGVLLLEHERARAAQPPFERAVSLRTKLRERFPNRPQLRAGLAQSLCNLADCLQAQGRIAEAGERVEQARGLLDKLLRETPQVTAYRFQLGLCHTIRGHVLARSRDDRAALEATGQAATIMRQLVAEHPAVPDYQRRLDRALIALSERHARLGETAQRLQALEEACTLQVRFAEAAPDDIDLAGRVALTQHDRAVTLRKLRRAEPAASAVAAAVQWHRRALSKQPESYEYRRRLAREHFLQAAIERDLGHPDAAIAAIDHILELWPNDANQLYRGAQEFALTGSAAKEAPATRDRCTHRALAALRRAVQAGFHDAPRARTDDALSLLRAEPDFQKLLQDIGKLPK
jgi:tetratricopeptide (TPR) repeat protein